MKDTKQWLKISLAVIPALTAGLSGQELMPAPENGQVRLFSSDLSVLESRDRRRDLPCEVKPAKPELGYDMTMHSGYTVKLPMKEAPHGDRLIVIARVRSLDRSEDDAMHFLQRIRTPEGALEGTGEFEGRFDIGEGNYHVDWLMRDPSGRVCSEFWDFRVELPVKGTKRPNLPVGPGVVLASRTDPYVPQPRTEGPSSLPAVTVFLSLTPMQQGAALLEPHEEDALLSMLRSIVREPDFGKVSLVAFNLEQKQVISRQLDRVDMPALKEALGSVKLGTVDVNALGEKSGQDARFLASIVSEHTISASAASENMSLREQSHTPPSAVIFLAPHTETSDGIPSAAKMGLPLEGVPVFHLSYAPNPVSTGGSDSISKFVRLFQGKTYEIRRPRDFFQAWPDVVAKIKSLSAAGYAAGFARKSN